MDPRSLVGQVGEACGSGCGQGRRGRGSVEPFRGVQPIPFGRLSRRVGWPGRGARDEVDEHGDRVAHVASEYGD